ncbi:MAG TPA: hypothetical protein VK508_15660 [Cyclobacteriaceae bacterium]|nr:hypothetical protein [Cyclobacteriaceae bacterium]
MKFKKIEISAFRIYDNPTDSTFDFTTESGGVANFVALYAPNGFGKTSFYDAVEWAVTKSINRFYIRNKELQRLAHYQHLENELPLIRNSKSNLETYVNIVFANDEKLDSRFRKHGKQKYDLNFDKPVVHSFQRVILSQEWISAFLTESDGETRYKKFMENPELVGISNYYNNLKHVQAAYTETTSALDRDITTLRIKIVNDGDNNLLTNINNQIVSLRQTVDSAPLKTITLSTTQEEIKELRDFLSGQIVLIGREVEGLEKSLDQIDSISTGNDRLISIATYYSFVIDLPTLGSQLSTILSNISSFEQMEKLENQLSGWNDLLSSELNARESINRIYVLFESYEKVHGEISAKGTSRSSVENSLSSSSKLLETQVKLEVSTKTQIENLIKRILTLEDTLARIPQIRMLLDQVTSSIKTLELEIESVKLSSRGLSETISASRTSIESFRSIIEAMHKGDFNDRYFLREESDRAAELKTLQDEMTNIRALIREVNGRIRDQKDFNNAVAEFIQTGLKLVNDGNLSICPLCEHPYTSHIHLVEKISKNQSLDHALQTLLLEENALSIKLGNAEKSYLEIRSGLEDVLRVKIKEQEDGLTELIRNHDSVNKELSRKQGEVRSLLTQQFEMQLEFKGAPIDDYVKDLEDRLTADRQNKKALEDTQAEIQVERERLQAVIVSAKQEINRISEEISLLLRDANYNTVIRWFEMNRQSSPGRDVL